MATELAEVRERLQAGVPLAEADRALLLELLQSGPDRRQNRVARRNRLIRELAEACCPNQCCAAQAARITTLARHYHSTAWAHDRCYAAMPERLQNRPEGILWTAFKCGVSFPFSPRQIDRILK